MLVLLRRSSLWFFWLVRYTLLPYTYLMMNFVRCPRLNFLVEPKPIASLHTVCNGIHTLIMCDLMITIQSSPILYTNLPTVFPPFVVKSV